MGDEKRQYKAKFVFKNKDRTYVIKGIITSTQDMVTASLKGATNLDFIKDESLINKLSKEVEFADIPSLVPEFIICVMDDEIDKTHLESREINILSYEDAVSVDHINITLDSWVLAEVKNILKERTNRYNELGLNLKRGAIAPSLSNVINEIIAEYLLKNKEKNYD